MKGFYNFRTAGSVAEGMGCHTSPNKRLLQQEQIFVAGNRVSCHTSPNERLLQLETDEPEQPKNGCHTSPNERLLQLAKT